MKRQITLDPDFEALLTHLHRGGQAGYYWRKGQGSTWWNGGSPPALPARNDVYFGVHPATAAGERGERTTLASVTALNSLFAEFDAKDFAGDKSLALAHVHQLEFSPSAIVDSGGGFHCYWLIDQPFVLDSDAARERARELQARWVAFVGGDTGAKDLARVLRVPGTFNTKYSPAQPVAFVRCELDLLYELDELAALIPPPPPPPPPAAPATVARSAATDRRAAYGQKALADEVARVALARQGTRNETLNAAAFTLGRKVAAGLLDEGDVERELVSAAVAAGLPVREAVATVRSGLQAGIAEGEPDALPDFDAPAPSSAPITRSSAAVALAAGEPPLSRGLVLKCLKEEEAGDAQLFTHLYQGRLVYDRAASAWYAFEGHAWRPAGGPPRSALWGRVAAAYLALAAELQGEIEKAPEDEQKKLAAQAELLMGRAKALRRLTRCNNVLTFAGDMGLLGITGEEWDRNPWLLGVANGVVDLRTGGHRAGEPADFIRTQAPTPWAGLDAPALRWERFIAEVMSGEADRVGFLHRALGYALNGTTREHILVLLVGERGRNGKGVLFETLRRVLGDYAGAVHTDVITGQQGHRTAGGAQPHLMGLRGRRLAYTSETADGAQMSADQVKLVTGGDSITARRLNENLVTFTPSHTLFVATNRRPHAPADDDALWERVKVLEFKARFVDEPGEPDERPRDPRLGETLEAEAPGILAWLVRGHLAYLASGLRTPESVKLARDAYRRGESIEPFIAARCVEWDGGQAEAGALWEAYRSWCQAEGIRPKTQHWFGRQLAARYEKGRTPGAGRACYYGVDLAPELAEEVQTSEKGSGGIRTPQTLDETDGVTRFCEPSEAISDRTDHVTPREGFLSDQGSQGSQGSQTRRVPAPGTPSSGDDAPEAPPGAQHVAAVEAAAAGKGPDESSLAELMRRRRDKAA